MKTLTLDDVTWRLDCLEEDSPIRGNALASGNDEEDRKCEDWIIEELESGNQWTWCMARVVGRYKGLKAVEYLGCCSYKSEEDFKQPGDYYDDMRTAVLADLQRQLEEIVADAAT